jgi:hypothetical protein
MKETIKNVVEKIRSLSELTKASAEENSEKAINILKESKKAIEVELALARAVTSGLVALSEAVRAITEGGAATTAAQALIKHVLTDAGARLNELGNVVQALGQDEKFAEALSDTEKAMEKFIALQEVVDANETYCELSVGDRVQLATTFQVPESFGYGERKLPPLWTKGTIKEIYPLNQVVSQDPAQKWVQDFFSKGAVKEARMILVEWDEYPAVEKSKEGFPTTIGGCFVLLPLDMIIKIDEADDAVKQS